MSKKDNATRRQVLKGISAAGVAFPLSSAVTAEENDDEKFKEPDCTDFPDLECVNVPEWSYSVKDVDPRLPFPSNKEEVGVGINVSYYYSGWYNGAWEHALAVSTLFGAYEDRDCGWNPFCTSGPTDIIDAFKYYVEPTDPDNDEAVALISEKRQGVMPHKNDDDSIDDLFKAGTSFVAGLINPALGGMFVVADLMAEAQKIEEGFNFYDNDSSFEYIEKADNLGWYPGHFDKCGGWNHFRFRQADGSDDGETDLHVGGTCFYSEAFYGGKVGFGSNIHSEFWSDGGEPDDGIVAQGNDVEQISYKHPEEMTESTKRKLGVKKVGDKNKNITLQSTDRTPEYIATNIPINVKSESIEQSQE